MLHLQAGIHLQKVKGFIFSDDKLDRASRLVIDSARQGNGLLTHGFAGGWINKRRWRLFNHFLVTALDRAVTLPEIDDIAVGITEYLNLNVPRTLNKLLNKHPVVTKAIQGFGTAGCKTFKRLLIIVRNPQALATAASRCFDHHGIADVLGNVDRNVRTINRFVKAWNRVDLGFHG